MPKAITIHRCTGCGADHPKWAGRCDVCGEWNTLVEEPMAARKTGKSPARARKSGHAAGATSVIRNVSGAESSRWTTGINEFDFVLGGGVVPGSMVLVGGEPGIGKSTLLLQVAARLQGRPLRALYVSGEESALQVKLRSDRLTDGAGDVELLNETSLETILATAGAGQYDVMFVDSIQTVYTEELEGAPGSVGQVRECAARLMRFAKDSGTAVLVVGHVTKSGGIAGPKTLEHIVDTVLYFEGEGTAEHRVLRATKNRFGSVDEIGVFRMSGEGLVAVGNPSELFLGDRSRDTSGSAVTALMEGSRPLLVEVQGLAAKSGYGTPQRVATGYDSKRLALLLAVLERRAGLSFSQMDVFLNIAGGIRMQEPAGDLAVATALASSVFDRALPTDAMFIGEVGLGGEIRPVAQVERRLAEGAKLGIKRAYVATRGVPQRPVKGVTVRGTATVQELFETVFA